MRYAISLSYVGTEYHGWQRQAPGITTVQQVLEDRLAELLGSNFHISGCGRTDAGVHASAYYAHVDVPNQHQKLTREDWNTRLPSNIRILQLRKTSNDWHAQRSAIARTYTYRIATKNDERRAPLVGQYGHLSLDVTSMLEVTKLYVQSLDFKSFCRKATQYKHTNCRIDACSLTRSDIFPELIFSITANRFLQNMVRLLVARMIDVGKGSMEINEIEAALIEGKAFVYQRPAYANGLSLSDVQYDKDPFA